MTYYERVLCCSLNPNYLFNSLTCFHLLTLTPHDILVVKFSMYWNTKMVQNIDATVNEKQSYNICKTLSYVWDTLNLPVFLFNVGLLTLIKIDSLMFLAKPCSSLPII